MQREEDGVSYRSTLEDLLAKARYRGDAADIALRESQLACPPFPVALDYHWRLFLRISARRSSGFGLNPITWLDLFGFSWLTRTPLRPWEIDLIERLDNAFRASTNPQRPSTGASNG